MPPLLTPLSIRLVPAQPVRELSFEADIDGFILVMQEVDTPKDPLAKVRMHCSNLSWRQWLYRKVVSWQKPKLSS